MEQDSHTGALNSAGSRRIQYADFGALVELVDVGNVPAVFDDAYGGESHELARVGDQIVDVLKPSEFCSKFRRVGKALDSDRFF